MFNVPRDDITGPGVEIGQETRRGIVARAWAPNDDQKDKGFPQAESYRQASDRVGEV